MKCNSSPPFRLLLGNAGAVSVEQCSTSPPDQDRYVDEYRKPTTPYVASDKCAEGYDTVQHASTVNINTCVEGGIPVAPWDG